MLSEKKILTVKKYYLKPRKNKCFFDQKKDDDIPNMFPNMSFSIKSFWTEGTLKLISLHLVCLNYMTSKLGDRNLLERTKFKNCPTERRIHYIFKRTVSITLCDPSGKNDNARFTTVLKKYWLIKYELNNNVNKLEKLIFFNCGFSKFLLQSYCRTTYGNY